MCGTHANGDARTTEPLWIARKGRKLEDYNILGDTLVPSRERISVWVMRASLTVICCCPRTRMFADTGLPVRRVMELTAALLAIVTARLPSERNMLDKSDHS